MGTLPSTVKRISQDSYMWTLIIFIFNLYKNFSWLAQIAYVEMHWNFSTLFISSKIQVNFLFFSLFLPQHENIFFPTYPQHQNGEFELSRIYLNFWFCSESSHSIKKDLKCDNLKSLDFEMELPGRFSNKSLITWYDYSWTPIWLHLVNYTNFTLTIFNQIPI